MKTGANVDYETDDTHREIEYYPPGVVFAKFYRGKVNYTVDGNASAIEVLIKVTDVEATMSAAPTVTRTTFSEPSNPALDATWTAASANGLTISGYNAQYRKKAAQGETPADWTDYTVTDDNDQQTSNLSATTTSINLPDLDAGATYEVRVRAVTTEEADGPWSDIGEGTANRPPTASKSISNFSLQWYKFGNSQSHTDLSNGFFQDADGDTISYSASSEYAGVIKAWLDSNTLKIQTLNPTGAATTVTYGASDAYGGYVSRTVDVTGTIGTVQASIYENACCGRFVRQITGVEYDDGDDQTDDTLSYTLTGDAFVSGPFVHNSSSGWISLGPGKSLDYETKSSYTATLSWTVQEQTASVTVNISVTDVEAGKPAAPTLARTEYSEPTDPGLDVSWTRPALTGEAINRLQITGYEVQYRKKVADGETPNAWVPYKYDDPSNPGTEISELPATPTSLTLPGLDAGATYEVQVRAIGGVEGPGAWSDSGEGTTNRPPTASKSIANFSLQWFRFGNSLSTTDLSNGFFADADGDTISYSASSERQGVIKAWLDSNTLKIQTRNPTGAATTVTYGASDAYGGYVSQTVDVTGTMGTVQTSIYENACCGRFVRNITGVEYDDGDDQTDDTLSYTLTGDAFVSGPFVHNSSSGWISLGPGKSLDYETKSSYTATLSWEVQEQTASVTLNISVTDVEAGKPNAPTLARTEYSEPTDPGLDVSWTRPALTGEAINRLQITGYEVRYRKKVADGETPNAWVPYKYDDPSNPGTEISELPATPTSLTLPGLDAGATYEVQVRAIGGVEGPGAWSDSGEGTTNRPPTASKSIANFSLQWFRFGNSLSTTDLSNGFFTDADGDTISYSASSERQGVIKAWLDSNTLKIRTENPTGAATTVTYGASDAYGGYVSQTVDVTGTIGTVQASIYENACCGRFVRNITGVEYDDGDDQTDDTLSYTLTGDAFVSGPFVHNSSSGWISLGPGKSLDYETKSSYTATLSWTVQEQTASVTLNISVADVEAGKPAAPTLARTEYSEPTDPGLDVSWTRPALTGEAINRLQITGYEVRYRKKVADGETPNAWVPYKYDDPSNPGTEISELPATPTSLTLPGLDAGATYEVQVRAIGGVEGPGAWSDSGEGTTNRPPTASKSIANFSLQWFRFGNSLSTTDLSNGFFADADGDTISYSASSERQGVIKAWLDSNTLKIQTRNPTGAATTVTYGASDAYGGYVSQTVDVTGTMGTVQTSIYENACCGRFVRNITGVEYDDGDDQTDDTLSYTLTGDAFVSGPFVHNSSSGWISLGPGKSLDYETKSSYTATLSWTVQEQTASVTVNISVTDVEAGKPAAPTLARTEYSEPTDPGLDVSWTRPALTGEAINRLQITGYEVQYRKKVADGETPNAWVPYKYDDPSNPGTEISELPATPTSLTLPGLDAGATYEVQVRAIGGVEGPGAWSDSGEGTTNRPPTASSVSFSGGTLGRGGSFTWHEAQPLGNGSFFTDPDGDTLTYSASAQRPALLGVTVTGTAGTNAVLTANLLNQGASKVNYIASDGYGGTVTRSATITITAKTSRSIAENSAAGTTVGAPVTGTPYDDGDPLTDDALTYSLTGNAATYFAINSATGQISVKTGASIDYEAADIEEETHNGEVIAKFYRGKVNYTVNGNTSAIDVIIRVTNVETGKAGEPTLARTTSSVAMNPALDVSWTALTANGLTTSGYEVQYRKKVADGETPKKWTLYEYDDPANLNNQLSKLPASTSSLTLTNLDAGATYEVQVRAVTSEEDEGPWSDTGERTANTPPAASSVALATATATWKTATDYDLDDKFEDADDDELTYSASAAQVGVLTVAITGDDSDTLTVTPLNPAASVVTYTAADAYGGRASRTVTITGQAGEFRSIAENSAAGTAVGAPVTGTQHGTTALTYSLSGDAATYFEIGSATGQISVKQGTTLDYETTPSYTGKVNWTVQGQAAVANLTINVTDVGAGKTGTPTLTRTRFSEPSDPALDVTWAAPTDTGLTITGYEAEYRKQAAAGENPVAWTPYSGTLAATATTFNLPSLDAGATYEVRIRVLVKDDDPGPWSDIGSAAANTPPAASSESLADATLTWKTSTSYDLSDKFTDADGDTLTYAASAAQAGVLTVAITGEDSDTLTVTPLNPAASVVTYTAADAYGGRGSRTVTITGQAAETRSIAENSAAGTAVGAPRDGHAAWDHRSDLLAVRRCGDLLRHQRRHRPDQREAGRHPGLRDHDLPHRRRALDRAGPDRRRRRHH